MKSKLDLIGKRFGRLVVLEKVRINGYARCRCQCDCGNISIPHQNNLMAGVTRSCGCRSKVYGEHCKNLRMVWCHMKARCYRPNNDNYKHYGGRGIIMCPEWVDSFGSFYKWSIENKYQEGLQIDRIDPNKNYEPGNCTWATTVQQSRNKRNTNYQELNGERKCLADWCDQYGISYKVVSMRLSKGWSFEQSITTPVKRGPRTGTIYLTLQSKWPVFFKHSRMGIAVKSAIELDPYYVRKRVYNKEIILDKEAHDFLRAFIQNQIKIKATWKL